MSTKIHVDSLDAATSENELNNLFSTYGNVMEVNIVNVAVDHAGHKPRRFGFVTMATPEGARAAIQALNGNAACSFSVNAAGPREARAKFTVQTSRMRMKYEL